MKSRLVTRDKGVKGYSIELTKAQSKLNNEEIIIHNLSNWFICDNLSDLW